MHGIADDGKTAVLVYSGTAGGQEYKTYMARDDSSEPILLGDGDPTSISPDGKWILSQTPSDPSKIIFYPTETGQSRKLDLGQVHMLTGKSSWSLDNTKIVFAGAEPGHLSRRGPDQVTVMQHIAARYDVLGDHPFELADSRFVSQLLGVLRIV